MTSTAPPSDDLWLHGRRYDLMWYGLAPLLLWGLLVGMATAIGPRGPFVAYAVEAAVIGLTHNALTWLLILPADGRRHYRSGLLWGPMVLAGLVTGLTVSLFGTPLFAWAVSLNITIAYYHIVRQHQGVLQACDARYVQATGDAGFRAVSRDWRWAVGALAAAGILWKGTGGPMLLGLTAPVQFQLMHVPVAFPAALTALGAAWALRFAWRLSRRKRSGLPTPVASLLVGGTALASLFAAAAVPNEQFFLTLALVASYHNVQYFAFCFTHHQLRAGAETAPIGAFSRFARDRRWLAWLALPLLGGMAVAIAILTLPPVASLVLGTWFMVSHYFVDGNMWRRKYYPLMGRIMQGRVGAPVPMVAVEAA